MLNNLKSKNKDIVQLKPVKSNIIDFFYKNVNGKLFDFNIIVYKICSIIEDNFYQNKMIVQNC